MDDRLTPEQIAELRALLENEDCDLREPLEFRVEPITQGVFKGRYMVEETMSSEDFCVCYKQTRATQIAAVLQVAPALLSAAGREARLREALVWILDCSESVQIRERAHRALMDLEQL